jgi:hypothetical protein
VRGFCCGDDLPLAKIREALALEVETGSLRRTARNVGMSPTGLRKFLEGTDPYLKTRRKLERWYVRERLTYGSQVTAVVAQNALRLLVQDLPPNRRANAVGRLLAGLEEEYTRARDESPEWLAELITDAS